MELVRQKNVATYIVFPIVDADGDIVTGAAGLDEEIEAWDDASAPDGFVDCSNTATEIAATGVYYLLMAQAEMNNDYIYVQVKTSTSGAKTQHILIRTMTGDPLLVATTESGRSIDVGTHGCVGIAFDNFATPSNTSAITNLTIPVVGTVTGAVTCDTVTSNLIIAGFRCDSLDGDERFDCRRLRGDSLHIDLTVCQPHGHGRDSCNLYRGVCIGGRRYRYYE